LILRADGDTVSETNVVRGELLACGDVNVRVALYVPAARPVGRTLTVTTPGALPETGVIVTHGWSAEAVQVRVPAPKLETLKVCDGGAAPPWVTVKPMLLGTTLNEGGGARLSVTGMERGELAASTEANVTVPLYVPGVSPAMAMLAVVEPGAVPEPGLTVSQGWSLLEVQVRVPLPVLVIVIVWGSGFEPPAMAVNARLVGANASTGVGVSTKVTLIV
jgi:hypothetical protein